MTASAPSSALSAGEAAPNPQLIRIRDLVYQVAGIFQPDNKLRLLEDRCVKRMEVLGAKTLREYYECLTVKPIRQAELVSLLNEITIGETCFFRNLPQLDALRNIVLLKIIEARANLPLRHLRIWSAGCSTGEEPYTLSMMLLEETASRLKGWTFEILATDLNERSLAHAKHGSYGTYSTRNLTSYYRQKYFTDRGDELHVNPDVKAHVNFSRLNLFDDSRVAFMKGLDLIMCCNVLIYFDGLSKRRVIQHFYNNLLAHGYLFLGHSESLYGISEDFRLVHLPSATAYVKSEKRQVNR
ncbi:MAG: protein-glutamate O-methyltransferase CheR [Acidobacteriia bacterium]|nr:protein-glutamate O-methyltransferase CheR [Terriglobia bacterium]